MQTCLLKINNLLEKHNLDALLISSVPNITYLTGYSGFSSHEREAYVLITKTKRYIFTDGRYSEAVVKQVPHFILKEISTQSPFISLLQTLIKKHALKNIGFEEDDLSVLEYNKLRKIHKSLKPFTLSTLRIHKSSNEIVAIKNACAIGDKAFAHIVKQATLGITEKQLAIELELWIKHFGADISFPSIVAFGANAAIPHHQTSDQRLTTNSFVLLDFGVKLDNYCSDMTRTIFFGKPSEKQKKIYETVRIAQQNAIQLITYNLGLITSNKTSLKASEVDRVARKYIIDSGFPTTPHSLGHGIGIEVHEAPSLSPKSKQVLENGMVFSIEPGIYIPGFGGVRIEDLFAIQKNTLVQLTQSPKEFLVL